MTYEIRIISEEDTVKSRPYEDLDSAIRIAEKIYNDFLDMDFGDEVVINTTDNLYNTLWANGKLFEEEIKIGDRVRIFNNGESYTTYQEFMIKYGTKEDCCNWDKGNVPSNNETIYEVKNIAPHGNNTNEEVAIISSLNHPFRTYMIGTKGLRKIWY